MGVTSRLLDAKSGTQFLAVTLGQTYYFEKPRVSLPDEVPHERQHLRLRRPARAHRLPRTGMPTSACSGIPRPSRSERARPHPVQARPAQVDQPRLPLPAGSAGPVELSGCLADRASTGTPSPATSIRSRHKAIERFAGFEYGSCCWRVRVLVAPSAGTSSTAHGPSRTPASTCSWNSLALPVSDRRTLS